MFVLAAGVVLFYGVYGYFVEAIVRIGFSVYQVAAVLLCIVSVTIIDVFIGRGAESRGAIQWGKMPDRSQYALFVLAVTFTWLMGLMGFARSGIRQHWHIWETMRDTSPDAVPQGETVLLRAERAGTGNGRVYEVTFTATDSQGEHCTGSVTVCVPHNRKAASCVDNSQQYDATQP